MLTGLMVLCTHQLYIPVSGCPRVLLGDGPQLGSPRALEHPKQPAGSWGTTALGLLGSGTRLNSALMKLH